MSFISYILQKQLKDTFFTHQIDLKFEENAVVAYSDPKCTRLKVANIMESMKFTAFFSWEKRDGHPIFSFYPYDVPDSFKKICYSILPSEKKMNDEMEQPEANYCTQQAIKTYLGNYIPPRPLPSIVQIWKAINMSRQLVKKPLTDVLSNAIRPFIKNSLPIVEIGAGMGYELELINPIIRLQPDWIDYQTLQEPEIPSLPENAYCIDIQNFCRIIQDKAKKIPLFFSLNVFDTLPPATRIKIFQELAAIQNKGDHLLIINDKNPLFDQIFKEIQDDYPDYALRPFFSLTGESRELSVIAIRCNPVWEKLPLRDFIKLFDEEDEAFEKGEKTILQKVLDIVVRENRDFKVIRLVEFYIEKVRNELFKCGYSSIHYYRNSYTEEIQQHCEDLDDSHPFFYSEVADAMPYKNYNSEDPLFLSALKVKNLPQPPKYQSTSSKRVLRGAEIVIIAATKSPIE